MGTVEVWLVLVLMSSTVGVPEAGVDWNPSTALDPVVNDESGAPELVRSEASR
jgi:hypothetical protein